MSICLIFKPFTGTRAKHALKVSSQTTGEYVSINLCPGHCTHPFTTSRALWHITWFALLRFLMKVHLLGMVMVSSGFSTNSHVPIPFNKFNSSSIALRHSAVYDTPPWVLMDSWWTPGGLLMDSSWTPSGLLVYSWWTPSGVHI